MFIVSYDSLYTLRSVHRECSKFCEHIVIVVYCCCCMIFNLDMGVML